MSTRAGASRRIAYVDYARGFSMLAIILFHYFMIMNLPGPLNSLIQFGGSGVHLFFLLSGFGLTLSRRKLGVLQFYARRLARVLLPYYLAIAVIACASYLVFAAPFDWYALSGHFFLFKMFDSEIMNSYGGQMWFMSALIQLYLVYPLLAKIQDILDDDLEFFVLGLSASLFWNAVLVGMDLMEQRAWNSFFLQFIWEFMLGMILARRLRQEKAPYWEGPLWLILSIWLIGTAIMAALVFGVPYGKAVNDYFALLSFGGLSVLAFRMHLFRALLSYTGKISLELYLVHLAILHILLHYFDGMLSLPVIVLFALTLSYAVSIPFAKFNTRVFQWIAPLLERFFAKKPQGPDASAAGSSHEHLEGT